MPFQYSYLPVQPYRDPYAPTLANLIGGGDRARAAALEQQGAIAARTAENIGQTVGSTLNNIMQFKLDEPKRQAQALQNDLNTVKLAETKKSITEGDAFKAILKATPPTTEDGLSLYNISAISAQMAQQGLDPTAAIPHLASINDAFRQERQAKQALVQRGAQSIIAGGNDPALAGHFIDQLEANGTLPKATLDKYRAFIAADPANVAKITAMLAGPQKLEPAAPGSAARNSITGQIVPGSQVAPTPSAAQLAADAANSASPTAAQSRAALEALNAPAAATHVETARHNAEMEKIGRMTAGRAAAAQAETARHNRVMEDPLGINAAPSGAPLPGTAAAPAAGAPPSAPAKANVPDYGYGNRHGTTTPKGLGFLGPLQRPDGGGVMTEYSMGVNLNGKETEIPTLVPTLTKDEVQKILTLKDGEKMPDSIVQKAVDFAKQRIAAGQDPFAGTGEQQPLYPDLTRAAVPATAADPLASGARNEAALAKLPPPVAAQVKAIVDGRRSLDARTISTPAGRALLNAVYAYDPSFDQVNYNGRYKTRTDFTSGASAKNVNALNTVIGHLQELSDAADGLHNTWSPQWNSLANAVSTATGNSAVKKFETIQNAVADEATRVWRQAGGTEADIKSWKKDLDAAGSPEQLHGVIASIGDLLQSKLEALQTQYQQGMGTNAIRVISPDAEKALQVLRGRSGADGGAPAAKPAPMPTAGEERVVNGQSYVWTTINGQSGWVKK